MNSMAFVSVHSEPGNLRGESILGGPPGSGENSADVHDMTEESQSDSEGDSKDNESMENVIEEISEHGDNEQSEAEENTDVYNDSNVEGDRKETSECVEAEEVSGENNEEDEVTKEVLEENFQQEERNASISEKHMAGKNVLKRRVKNKVTSHNLAEETAAVQSILLRSEVFAVNQELAPGSEFPDYESFESAVNWYSEVHGVTYVTAFSKTVSARNKECLKPFPECLRFTNLRLRCKHAGNPRASVARIRKPKLTCKTGCLSTLTVVAQRNPDRLRVTSFVEEHNHKVEWRQQFDSRVKQASDPDWLEAKQPSRHSRPSPRRKKSSRAETRALSNNLSPSKRTCSNGGSSPSPMVKIRSLDSLTSPLKSLPPFRLPTPSTIGQNRPAILKRKNAPVASVPKRRQTENLAKFQSPSGEHQYAITSPGPAFNEEVVIDISEDDDRAECEQSKAVARVNNAWKCVYRLLENDHQQLRAEADRLRRENQRLRAIACSNCGEKRT